VLTATAMPDPLVPAEQAIRFGLGDVPMLHDAGLAMAHGRARLRWLLEEDPAARARWKEREQRLAQELNRRLNTPARRGVVNSALGAATGMALAPGARSLPCA
jgi:hypothetical protein